VAAWINILCLDPSTSPMISSGIGNQLNKLPVTTNTTTVGGPATSGPPSYDASNTPGKITLQVNQLQSVREYPPLPTHQPAQKSVSSESDVCAVNVIEDPSLRSVSVNLSSPDSSLNSLRVMEKIAT
jgi:hypothetical protein